jgi:hypothetical protein
MRKGIFIPATVLRVAAGLLAAATVTVILAETPEIWRYIKMERM